jgi:hypothetical protein
LVIVDTEKSGMRKKNHLDAGIGGGSESIIELAFEKKRGDELN